MFEVGAARLTLHRIDAGGTGPDIAVTGPCDVVLAEVVATSQTRSPLQGVRRVCEDGVTAASWAATLAARRSWQILDER